MQEPSTGERLVYLAHATEDKVAAKPIAEGLIARGVNVWFDQWEIGYGDSLRRKMEQGLGSCTHFVALLTEQSILKPWVNEEIDVGLMSAVEGTAKFIGLRGGLALSRVPPLLRTRLTPEYVPGDDGLDALAAEIYGISKKPALGQKPKYVQSIEESSTWSNSAQLVAEYFVRHSENAFPMDLQTNYDAIQEFTKLPYRDVRLGVLDLVDAGVLEKREYVGGETIITAKPDLFYTFDGFFMDWNPEQDARELGVSLSNLDADSAECAQVAATLGWAPRRFNSAVAYLVSARVVKSLEYMGDSPFWPPQVRLGDELLRFVRNI